MAATVETCMLCKTPLATETEHALHLCKDHLEEQQEDYGPLPAVQPGGEVVWLVQVEQYDGDGVPFITGYETCSQYSGDLDVARVEIYVGVKARVILFNRESRAPVVWCYPWHKVLHYQEA